MIAAILLNNRQAIPSAKYDGFKTNLIGTPEQIAERIVRLKTIGVDLVLTAFLHFQEEVEYFGKRVLPIVRELEQQRSLVAA
jgi:FMNH2-dependent dimethyl sulfone monooxygenase